MNATKHLRHIFRGQLAFRGLLSAGLTAAVVFAFGLLTANLDSWWFATFPWMHAVAVALRSRNPWDFFVVVFIIDYVLRYLQMFQGVFFERTNLRALSALSRAELESSVDPIEEVKRQRMLLGGRRRLLDSIIRFDPTLWSLATLSVCFLFFGHVWSALVVLAYGSLVASFVPRMVTHFNSRHAQRQKEALAHRPIEHPKSSHERASRSMTDINDRLVTFVNRPLERLRVGWPVAAAAALTVVSVALFTITDMTAAGELPARATLIIVLLALTSRTALSTAQHGENVAFFASAVNQAEESDDDTSEV